MKSLALETNCNIKPEQHAELVMDTVSMVTRAIRHEMRSHRPVELSMPQFRAVGIVNHHPGASLSVVAGHLGLTTASASKLVDRLTKQGFLTRVDCPEDRRKIVLNVTDAGQEALRIAKNAALGRLTVFLEALDEADRLTVVRSMEILCRVLTEECNS